MTVIATGAVLAVVDVPVYAATWGSRTVKVAEIQFIAPSEDIPVAHVVDISVVAQRQIPLVLLKTTEILLRYIDKVIEFCCAGPANSFAAVRRQSRSHSCSSSNSWTRSLIVRAL